MSDAFQARIWYVIERADDVPGEWVGHCLDFDVVTQGRELPHTFEMLNEAVSMVVIDDLDAGREPRSRRAPEEFWQRLSKMLDRAEKRPEAEPFPRDPSPAAVYIYEVMFSAHHVTVPPRSKARNAPPRRPLVKQAFALQRQRAA